MLTFQQNEMQKKLHTLLATNRRELDKIVGNYSDAQKFFLIFLSKYLGREHRYRADFKTVTGLSNDVYRELRGDAKGGIKKESTLLKVVFGLGTTYEEAFLFFLYMGKYLLCDDPVMQDINCILLELDSLYGKSDAQKRMAMLDEMVGYYGLKL